VSIPRDARGARIWPRRYTLSFNPKWRFAEGNAEHRDPSSVKKYIVKLAEDIEENGLQNPLLVTVSTTQLVVHPGKCRVAALKLLGFETCPALFYDPAGPNQALRPGCRPITRKQARALFGGDATLKTDHRYVSVGKTR
jgi:hypothetical protein